MTIWWMLSGHNANHGIVNCSTCIQKIFVRLSRRMLTTGFPNLLELRDYLQESKGEFYSNYPYWVRVSVSLGSQTFWLCTPDDTWLHSLRAAPSTVVWIMIICQLPRKYKRHDCAAVVAPELSLVSECAQNKLSDPTLHNCIAALLRLGIPTSHVDSRKKAKQKYGT